MPLHRALRRFHVPRWLWFAVAIGSLAVSLPADERASSPAERFDRQIAPLLARRCLECHNGVEKKGGLDLTGADAARAGGDSGAVIVPGKLDDSPLWTRVAAGDMPPKQKLSAAEQQLLREWIESGAAWGQPEIDRFRYTSDARAGYDWWSLQRVTRPAVPTVESVWPRGDLDRFVLERLSQHGLQPSAEANRATLIRRLSFDLVGLPPTPAEIQSFVDDARPDAYEQLVERLLDSPQYGVRWARHWLDVIRFGESNGFEYDEFRKNAWPYRDWVVRALNSDMPYDRFARLQLAGDVLESTNLEARIATGFLAAGAYDTAGQSQQSAAMRAVVRQDEMEDLVGTIGQTFLGLTVNCARCHDHKFDPIRQREYYALVSAVSGVRQGERPLGDCQADGPLGQQIAAAGARRDRLVADLAAIEAPSREQLAAERQQKIVELKPAASWDFTGNLPPGLELHGSAHVGPQGLVLDGQTAYATAPLAHDLRDKTLEVWVRLANLKQRGGAALSVQTPDGLVFDAIVFGESEPQRWMAGSDNYARTQSLAAPAESDLDAAVHLCITYGADGTITAYRNGRPYGVSYRAAGTAAFEAGKAQLVFGLRHSPSAAGRMLAGTIERAQVYNRALSADEVATSSGRHVPLSLVLAQLSAEQRSRHQRLQAELSAADSELAILRPAQVYAVKPRDPETTHVLARGNPATPAEVVAPGGLAALVGPAYDFQLPPDAPESQRRLKLAEWIASEHNGLFARTVVNRLWHYHFGVGLVDTPNDFGFNGGRPSNALLLDWLASELPRRQYRLKEMHRLIVTSATYRQASKLQPEAAKIDADNRLLWRKSPQRLEAEAVRDAMLHVAGVLRLDQGGPGFAEMKMDVARGTGTNLYQPADPTLDAFKRRTLYRNWARSGRNPLLDVLDCPDPSTTTPRRAVTTTPLQALTLLNNAFVLHVCDKFAERLAREAANDVPGQVRLAYGLAFGRQPSQREQALAEDAVRSHGLPVLARALFNSNEFIYVD